MFEAFLSAVQPFLAPAFTAWGSPVSWLEIVAFVLALLMVLANLRVHPVAWPLAIASSLLYGLLFSQSKLYGETGLQLMFVMLAVWGWWQWLHGTADGHAPLRVRRMPRVLRWQAAAATLAAWPLLALLLSRYTDSDVPFLDALATVGSVCGQILLGRKYLENWPVWVAVNGFSVLLFAYKALWLTVLLYLLLMALALWGWRVWRRLAAT